MIRLNCVERTKTSSSVPEVLEQFLGADEALTLALVQFLHRLDGGSIRCLDGERQPL